MVGFLYDEFDLEASAAILWQESEWMRWSRKIATRRAKDIAGIKQAKQAVGLLLDLLAFDWLKLKLLLACLKAFD